MTNRFAAAGRWLVLRPSVLYALLVPLAFSILEMLRRGQHGLQFSLDVFDGDLPVLAALRDDWLRFGPSLWNPHLTSGNASLVQMALPPLTPDFLLSFFVPLFVAYFVTYAALIWTAGYGMHLFLRDSLGLRGAACVVGAVIYMFSFWHYIHGFVVPLVPLLLWLTDRWARATQRRWRYGVALVAIGTFSLYAGLLQLVVVVAALQLAYLLVANWKSGRVRRLASEWLIMWAACGLLFAPVALTQLVYLADSHRTIWDLATPERTAPDVVLKQTISIFGSALGAIPISGVTTGSAGYAGTFFVGGIALPLMVIGLFAARGTRARFLLALLVAIPLLYVLAVLLVPVQSNLGFLKSFQLVRVRHLFPFVLAANAAIGADVLFSGRWRDFPRTAKLAAFAIVVAIVALLAAEAAASVAHWARHPHAGRASIGWLLAAVSIGVGTLLGCAVLVAARRLPRGVALGGPILVICLLGLVGERAVYARAERLLHGGLGTWAAAMKVDPGFAFIDEQADGDLHRTLTAGSPTNRAVVSGLYDAGGYQSIYPLAYHELFGVLTDPHLLTNEAHWRYYHTWGNRAFPFGPELDFPVANLIGIRWIWSRGFAFEDPRLVSRFQSGDITVYENTAAFPRAFVVDQVRTFPTETALLDAIRAADDELLRHTAFMLDSAHPPGIPSPAGAATSAADISRYSPDRVDIDVHAAAPGLVVLTDAFAPGWTATVCGAPATIYRVDVAFRAVAVPAGTCTVTFSYRPAFTYAGILLAGVATLGLAGFALLMLRRDRR